MSYWIVLINALILDGSQLAFWWFMILLQHAQPFLCNIRHSSLKESSECCSCDYTLYVLSLAFRNTQYRIFNGCNPNYSCTKRHHNLSYRDCSGPTAVQFTVVGIHQPSEMGCHPFYYLSAMGQKGWETQQLKNLL